jgi:hypothetical protein
MQLNLPIFPSECRPVNTRLSVLLSDGFVYYFVNGNPIRTHPENSTTDFKFHIAEMILLNICKKSEVCRFFNVSKNMILTACKTLEKDGIAGFYKERKNQIIDAHLLPENLRRMQEGLDRGESNVRVAKQEGVHEGTIRYNIKIGKLKKKR